MRPLLLWLISFGIVSISVGQQSMPLEGLILDSNSNPIPFSHIKVISENSGTLSNEHGRFSIVVTKFPVNLSVSHVGYKTTSIEINDAKKSITVILEDEIKKLNEIVVRGLSAKEIVEKAIAQLRFNFEIDTLGYTIFTQTTKRTVASPLLIQEFVHYLFSLRGVQNEPYIIKSRSKSFNKEGDELQRKSRVTPVLATESDLMLKYQPYFLKKSKMRRYNYSFLEDITYNNELFYRIFIESIKSNYTLGGEVWIHPENFGITYVKTNFMDEEFDEMSTIDRQKEIFYEMLGNKWYLSHSIHSLTILPKDSKDKIFSSRTSVVISKQQGYHLPKGEKLQYHIEKSKKFRESFDSEFWDSYNYIPIPEPFKSQLAD